jgi:hypothetical protein
MKKRWRDERAPRRFALCCESCGRLCSMTLRTDPPAPGAVVITALHRCLKCTGFQDFTVRDTQGDLHRVQADRVGCAVIDERPPPRAPPN